MCLQYSLSSILWNDASALFAQKNPKQFTKYYLQNINMIFLFLVAHGQYKKALLMKQKSVKQAYLKHIWNIHIWNFVMHVMWQES